MRERGERLGKLRVTPTCYVALLNEELRRRHLADQGWCFACAAPEDGEAGPYRFDGPAAVESAVLEAVDGQYVCCRPL